MSIFTQGKAMKLMIGRKVRPVADYAEASAIWAEYRDSRQLGSSRAPLVQVIESDGTPRHVSYNGKVWAHRTGRDWQVGATPIYDPIGGAAVSQTV